MLSSMAVKRGASSGISALISGAGIGGLTAALELWRRGCDVRVLERTKTNVTTGDSIVIGPSATKMLRNWPEMKRRHDQITYEPLIAMCKHTGELVQGPMEVSELAKLHGQKGGTRVRSIQNIRPKLSAMLLEQLAKSGIEVEYDKEVVDYFEDGSRAGVVLKDGSKPAADVVVAADGLRGASWGLVAGHPVPAKSSGSAIFRASYPVELAMADPLVAERFKLRDDGRSVCEVWIGPKMFATFWRNDTRMMWSITHPDHGTAEESWSNRIKPEAALAFTSTIPDWPEVANRVIKATPSDQLVDWRLMWRDPQPKWTSPGGHVIQLGDAAHCFLPSSGNGGTQAMEDAVSLAACLAIGGSKDRIPDATRVHNLLRFERVSFLQAMGVANREGRNSEKKLSKRPPVPGRWLSEHDPEEYAYENFDKALAHITDQGPFQNTNRPRGVEYAPWTIDELVDDLDNGRPTILDGDWS